jgi:hypothetical protein
MLMTGTKVLSYSVSVFQSCYEYAVEKRSTAIVLRVCGREKGNNVCW